MSKFISATDLAAMLADRILSLLAELLPGGRRIKHEWVCGSLAGEKGHSLSVRLTGQKIGVWADFATGQKGADLLDLIAACLHLSIIQAMDGSRRWLGIDDGRAEPVVRPKVVNKTPKPKPDNTTLALRIWKECVNPAGTIIETYLASRGLRLPDNNAIRFHPACPFKKERLPAMVALLRDVHSDAPCSIHRTVLLPDGRDRDRVRGRAMLGTCTDAAIKLSPDDEVTMGLGIAEGIETALTIIDTLDWRPVWATGSAGNIASFPILAGIDELTIFADRDPNSAGQTAARTCAKRWAQAGKLTAIEVAP